MCLLNVRKLIAVSLYGVLLAGCNQQVNNTADVELKKMIQQEQDAREIQNLMSRRAYYHGASDQASEIDLYAQRTDSSFCQNQGCRVGVDNIRQAFVERFAKVRQLQLKQLHELYPQIQETEEWMHTGNFQTHTLSTPIIEIAEDGQTAKGMWYTPGAIAWPNTEAHAMDASWIWEKYAVDFIKEEGAWKFWHVMVLTDFVVGFDKTLQVAEVEDAPEGAEGSESTGEVIPALPRDVNWNIYQPLAPTTVPRVFPPMPEPYDTFANTFSYGPDMLESLE